LAAINPIQASLQPIAENLNQLGLPDWLVHWGHPGNMAVVLIAMGGYGALYLGWQIRLSDDADVIEKAKDMHPKLAAGMSVFFALGAIGGLLSLTMQGKDIMSSPHFITGVIGLLALATQAMLPLFFSDDPNSRGMVSCLKNKLIKNLPPSECILIHLPLLFSLAARVPWHRYHGIVLHPSRSWSPAWNQHLRKYIKKKIYK
jgi:Protein of unknown function (DUF4079)